MDIPKHDCVQKILNALSKPNKAVRFGPFQHVLEGRDCPVCQIFTHLVEQALGTDQIYRHETGGEIPYRVTFYSYIGSELIDDVPELGNGEIKNIGVRVLLPRDEFARIEELVETGTWPAIAPGPNTFYSFDLVDLSKNGGRFPSPTKGLDMDPEQDRSISGDFLCDWLNYFKRYHGSNCSTYEPNQTSVLPRGFRLLDINNMNVVDGPRNATYVALSYVWGANYSSLRATRSTMEQLRKTNGLLQASTSVARTVIDAMAVVRKLGLQYLWVDSLCIIQDDPNDKLDQISSMGVIYEAAELVIVAAFGNDANAGLPGIDEKKFPLRAVEKSVMIHDEVRLCSSLAGLDETMSGSPWSHRAWTLQEALLSNLQLYFTPSQAHLSCSCGYAADERKAVDVFETHGTDPAKVDPILVDLEYQWVSDSFNVERDCLWNEYHGILMDYTARKLTNPSDILSAFTALMDMLEAKWDTKFVFGLPKSLFIPALLWEHGDSFVPLKRRTCLIPIRHKGSMIHCPIPSWSWAGWYGGISLALDLHNPEVDCQYQPTEIDADWRLSAVDVSLALDDPLRHTLLQADVWTACFTVGRLERREEQNRPFDHLKHPIYLAGEKKALGYVRIPVCSYWAPSESDRPNCEFLGITLGLKQAWYAKHYLGHRDGEENIPVVDAMLVSRQANGIAYRVGIAGIRWDDWKKAGPVRKPITLG